MSEAQPLMGRSDDGPRRRSRAVLRAGRGSPLACVVAGAAVGVIALVLGAMVVQQWSVGSSIAEAAMIAGETTPAQSVLAISVLLLALGAVLTPVIGLRRRKS